MLQAPDHSFHAASCIVTGCPPHNMPASWASKLQWGRPCLYHQRRCFSRKTRICAAFTCVTAASHQKGSCAFEHGHLSWVAPQELQMLRITKRIEETSDTGLVTLGHLACSDFICHPFTGSLGVHGIFLLVANWVWECLGMFENSICWDKR